ncbi:hypothetical protein [Rhizobium sp. Root1204]|uniref:hypothetical protein n=1 Tax=Rhizobium sp. Root1204 TaxID=1736428 RepID=UPI000A718A19|nr:hypothetical protein [Rhizobium sp. Root1204]
MKGIIAVTYVSALICSAQPCLSENIASSQKTITEEEVRTLSGRLYRNILIAACKNGWRYPRKQLEHGFKRHLQELKLQLSNDGYRIVPSDNTRRRSPMVMVREWKSPTFGCERQYWRVTRD